VRAQAQTAALVQDTRAGRGLVSRRGSPNTWAPIYSKHCESWRSETGHFFGTPEIIRKTARRHEVSALPGLAEFEYISARVMNGEDAVQQMFRDGQRKWPRVALSFEIFSEHCRRVLTSSDAEPPPSEAADLYLCCACAEAVPEALRAFESEGMTIAKVAIARIDRDADFVQETLQEVWDKLLLGAHARVRQYSGRGPLKAWVRVTATRVALDRYRARGRLAARQVELTERFAAAELSPEAFLTKARFGNAFQKALRDAVAALSTQERNVLRMHVAGQCSIDEIGRAYNVHRATAARWLDRSRARIYETVRQELCGRRNNLTASEFKSLATLMGSELELSLTGNSALLSAHHSQLEG
jgi:RNA polymerase sigma-70 factor, ECF subfamily